MINSKLFFRSLLPSGQGSLPGPAKVYSQAVKLLADGFDASRVVIFTRQKGRAIAKATYEHCSPGVTSIMGSSFPAVTQWDITLLEDWEVVAVTDINKCENLPKEVLRCWIDWGVRSFLAAPVVVNDSVAAIICVQQQTQTRVWTSREIERFLAAIDKLSHTLEIVRPFAELRKEFDQYLAVNDLARQVTLLTSVDDVFRLSVNILRRIFAFDMAIIYLIDEITGRLQDFDQARYSNGEFTFGNFLPINYSIAGWCVANRHPLVTADLRSETKLRVRPEWLAAGLTSCAAFPLIVNGDIKGTILLLNQYKANLGETEKKILEQAMEQAAAAIHRIRTMESLIRSSGRWTQQREALIKRISKVVSSHSDCDIILQNAVMELGRFLSVSRCYIALVSIYEESVNQVFEYRAPGVKPLNLPLPIVANKGLMQSIYAGEPIVFANVKVAKDLEAVAPFLRKNQVITTVYNFIAENNEVRAFLIVEHCSEEREWKPDELSLLVTVSQELAIALEQANLIAQLQSQAERETLVNRITGAIRASLDHKTILQTTVAELGKTLGADSCFIGITDSKTGQVFIESEYVTKGQALPRRVLDLHTLRENLELDKSGKFFAISDSTIDARLDKYAASPSNAIPRALAYVPIYTQDQMIGIIGVSQERQRRHWRREELALMSAVADQVAVAISQARLLEQSKAQAQREILINQVFKILADSLNQGEILEKVAAQIGRALEVDRCTIVLVGPNDKTLNGSATYLANPNIEAGSWRQETEMDAKQVEIIQQKLSPLWLNTREDVNDPVLANILEINDVQALMAIPLIVTGKFIGIISVAQRQQRLWRESDIEILRVIASQTAVAINNLYLFQRVQESQNRWQRTFDSMTDGVALVSRENRVLDANKALLRLCQVDDVQELLGHCADELFIAHDGQAHSYSAEAMRTATNYQVELEDRKGRVLRQNIDPIVDEHYHVSELVLVVRNVTNERRAEQEMAQRNRQLSILNAIAEEITRSLEIDKIIVSAFGYVVELMAVEVGFVLLLDEKQEQLQPVAYRGSLPEEFLAKLDNLASYREIVRTIEELPDPLIIADVPAANLPLRHFVDLAAQMGVQSAMVTKLKSKNHQLGVMIIAFRQKRIFAESEVRLVTAVGRQVGVAVENARLIANLQEALEELREANRLKDEFLATLSHELRTPLTSIRGWAELLVEREELDDEMLTGLQSILNNSEALQQLINDLLELSRIENRMLKLELEPSDINLVIMAAMQTVKQMADDRDIRLEQDLSLELPKLSLDTNRLQQVFWNLLVNGIKFSRPQGYVRITTCRVDNFVEILVADNGIGIDASFLPLVFERFRQADSSSTRRYGGLGIGLSLVKSLVEAHNGEVRAESAGRNQGSTFTIRLPIPSPDAFTRTPNPGIRLSDIFQSDKAVALIIEDLEDNLRLLSSVIERSGYQVLAVRSTEAGLRLAERCNPHLILLDINMPGRGPQELLHLFRHREELATTPVLAVSSFVNESERQQILSIGFDGLITKPFRRSEIQDLIKRLAKMRQ